MIHYTCDICDTANIDKVREVIILIKVRGQWFGDRNYKQVCTNCLDASWFYENKISSNAFKLIWKKLWQKNQK